MLFASLNCSSQHKSPVKGSRDSLTVLFNQGLIILLEWKSEVIAEWKRATDDPSRPPYFSARYMQPAQVDLPFLF